MIAIADHAEGCVLSVRAQPGARRNAIVGEQAGALKVAVTAPPDKGRANDALVEVLADALSVKRSQIELVSGQTNRQKRFLIRGMTSLLSG
ncbi:MAG: YggU family protein [Planctomycetes bacterium]|nr:YggU family protein [Planctomycetota bacterium]